MCSYHMEFISFCNKETKRKNENYVIYEYEIISKNQSKCQNNLGGRLRDKPKKHLHRRLLQGQIQDFLERMHH